MRKLLAVLLVALVIGCRPGQPPGETQSPAGETREVRPLTVDARHGRRLLLPNRVGSVKFAVIGDSGRGNRPQHEVAAQMTTMRKDFKFSFVLMNGDNIYEGPATAEDYRAKFEEPYRELLDAGVKFYAALGNHDDPRQVYYAPFNMNGRRYYTFSPPEDPITRLLTSVRIFALDTVTLDREQLRWLSEQLRESRADWKICFSHHPIYTSGRYQLAALAFRLVLEPMFVDSGVDVVFAGHEHFYMRSTLRNGIQYFVSGGAGSLRVGDSASSPIVARAFDTDYHFMLIEVERDVLSFQAIARTGETVDAGQLVRRRPATSPTSGTGGPLRSPEREP